MRLQTSSKLPLPHLHQRLSSAAMAIASRWPVRLKLPRWSKQENSSRNGRSTDHRACLRLPGSTVSTRRALFLCGLRTKGVELTGIRPEPQALLDLVGGLDLKPLPKVA